MPSRAWAASSRARPLGIIGYGAIGEHLAPLGVALGMTVLVADPYTKVDDAGAQAGRARGRCWRKSDFVVCLAVANEQTENLMNAANFARMKPSAYFINLSRGNLVDEAALLARSTKKRIAGAAMDVGRAQDQKPSLDARQPRRRDRDAAHRGSDAGRRRASGLRHRAIRSRNWSPAACRRARPTAGRASAEPPQARLTKTAGSHHRQEADGEHQCRQGYSEHRPQADQGEVGRNE